MLRENQSVAILGFGVEGRAVLEYLWRHGIEDITICDRQLSFQQSFIDKHPGKSVKWQIGKDYLTNLGRFDVIFRSPGIHCEFLALQEARREGAVVTSSTDLFLREAKGKKIGVTGTKGKGTTSTLIYEILKGGGFDVYLGGNIGRSPLEFIDDLKDDSVTVLEMSSFQLQDLKVSPDVSVVLNTTVEHMDYHEHVEEYWEAKSSIVRYQDENGVAVFNQDYEYADYFERLTKARTAFVSTKGKVGSSGENVKKSGGEGKGVLKVGGELPIGAFLQKDAIVVKPVSGELFAVCKTEEVGLIGAHNLENILPAVVVGVTMGVEIPVIKKAVIEFKGLPHRLELVGEIEGVRYYNDSFSTTPETCIAAIGAFKQPIVLMVGGSEKNSDFRELAKKIVKTKNLKAVVFMGDEAAKRIEDEIEKYNDERTEKAMDLINAGKSVPNRDIPLKLHYAKTFGEAFLAAKLEAVDGDVVLLSPACASFNWFKDYKARGDLFREMVRNC